MFRFAINHFPNKACSFQGLPWKKKSVVIGDISGPPPRVHWLDLRFPCLARTSWPGCCRRDLVLCVVRGGSRHLLLYQNPNISKEQEITHLLNIVALCVHRIFNSEFSHCQRERITMRVPCDFLFLGGTGVWTHGFVLTRQVLDPLNHASSSFSCSDYFGDRVSLFA
jgi:hypothetical protein